MMRLEIHHGTTWTVRHCDRTVFQISPARAVPTLPYSTMHDTALSFFRSGNNTNPLHPNGSMSITICFRNNIHHPVIIMGCLNTGMHRPNIFTRGSNAAPTNETGTHAWDIPEACAIRS